MDRVIGQSAAVRKIFGVWSAQQLLHIRVRSRVATLDLNSAGVISGEFMTHQRHHPAVPVKLEQHLPLTSQPAHARSGWCHSMCRYRGRCRPQSPPLVLHCKYRTMAKHHLLHARAPITKQEHAAVAAHSHAKVIQLKVVATLLQSTDFASIRTVMVPCNGLQEQLQSAEMLQLNSPLLRRRVCRVLMICAALHVHREGDKVHTRV